MTKMSPLRTFPITHHFSSMQQLVNGAVLECHSFEYFPVARHYFVPILQMELVRPR